MKNLMISLIAILFVVVNLSSILAQTTGTFTDPRDGKTYKTVKIGEQVWMAENLAYKTSSGSWAYNNDESNVAKYGRLYNWETATTACPAGWHLPSDAEWTALEDYLIANGYNWDGTTTDNKTGKSLAATSGWKSNDPVGVIGNDQASNNSTGFSALPGGFGFEGTFFDAGGTGIWWSATKSSGTNAWNRYLDSGSPELFRHNDYVSGSLSVRCLKN